MTAIADALLKAGVRVSTTHRKPAAATKPAPAKKPAKPKKSRAKSLDKEISDLLDHLNH